MGSAANDARGRDRPFGYFGAVWRVVLVGIVTLCAALLIYFVFATVVHGEASAATKAVAAAGELIGASCCLSILAILFNALPEGVRRGAQRAPRRFGAGLGLTMLLAVVVGWLAHPNIGFMIALVLALAVIAFVLLGGRPLYTPDEEAGGRPTTSGRAGSRSSGRKRGTRQRSGGRRRSSR